MSTAEFSNVTVATKANIYFEGRVVSHTLRFVDGSRKTLGLVYPGEYHFSTDAAERVELMLTLRRPAVSRSARDPGSRVACREKRCRNELPPGASFCPRCGTRVTPIWREGL